jgi:hypothetical protein
MHGLGPNEIVRELRMEINRLLPKQERMWQQRSRNSWLTEGDRNIQFFHNQATQRHQKNPIDTLWDVLGEWIDVENLIAMNFETYFKSMFSTFAPL